MAAGLPLRCASVTSSRPSEPAARAASKAGMQPAPRSFIKWAGGKGRLLPQILPHVPTSFGRYHEPFVGSGALFFHLGPARARLSDNNVRLIRTYRGLRDDPEGVIRLLKGYPHDKDFFLQLRKRNIDKASDVAVAAWFIYLNKTAFNGLYRVNSKNVFNVPFGDYKRPAICDAAQLRRCSKLLEQAKIEVESFEVAAGKARRGDFVYFDPPYVPLSRTSSFTSYTQGGFGLEEHELLRDVAARLKRRGVDVLISNSSAPEVRELYGAADFEIVEISARRSINSKGGGRGAITELLIK
jgi:DNA adenine methylase